MPLEIKELYIRVTVNQPNQETGPANSKPLKDAAEDQESLVKHCIEEMMSILKDKKER